jgi:hypothetical protein
VQLGRAYALSGDKERCGPDILIFNQAKAEYAKL